MSKKNIVILYGGKSVEHGVSINSAKNVLAHIDKEAYEPIPIGITPTGKWYLTSTVTKDITAGKEINLLLDPTNPGFWVPEDKKVIQPDVIFPMLHGTDGEDGSIQGLLKAVGLPMIGTGVLGSSVSMNKITTKRLLQHAGIPTSRFIPFTLGDKASISYEAIVQELGSPFMLKAANLGSSVGVSKVSQESDFSAALEEAFSFDNQILVEEYIQGREIECAVLGNFPPEASMPAEIIIQGNYDFYTFEAKYVDAQAVHIELPAQLEKDITESIRKLAIQTFQVLQGRDFARVDLFLTPDGRIYINEINTIPGFTDSSMFPSMWNERGIGFSNLISRLIDLARERDQQEKRVAHQFDSALKY